MGDNQDQASAVIIVAAGRGSRLGQAVPKQYLPLAGKPVLTWTLERFLGHPAVGDVIVVIHPDDQPLYDAAVARLALPGHPHLREPVAGGATRQLSVAQGMEALAVRRPPFVMIHDAARPFVDDAVISRTHDAAVLSGAAVPGTRVTDTIKSVDGEGRVTGTPARDGLRAVQTPQGFRFSDLLAAHRAAIAAGRHDFTDDGALAEWAGLSVRVVDGATTNTKITTAEDLAEANRRMLTETMLTTRTGIGYDVHAFGEGDHVWLGGVRIAHDQGVVAHSDGDVALHALTDAVLGALADGDIGTHFPPTDPQWRGASSDRFLAHAVGLVRARGGIVDHLDVAIICEAPKVGPHRDAMRERMAEIAGIPVSAVSVKATTSERLGFTGRREGLAAQAIATIRLP